MRSVVLFVCGVYKKIVITCFVSNMVNGDQRLAINLTHTQKSAMSHKYVSAYVSKEETKRWLEEGYIPAGTFFHTNPRMKDKDTVEWLLDMRPFGEFHNVVYDSRDQDAVYSMEDSIPISHACYVLSEDPEVCSWYKEFIIFSLKTAPKAVEYHAPCKRCAVLGLGEMEPEFLEMAEMFEITDLGEIKRFHDKLQSRKLQQQGENM